MDKHNLITHTKAKKEKMRGLFYARSAERILSEKPSRAGLARTAFLLQGIVHTPGLRYGTVRTGMTIGCQE